MQPLNHCGCCEGLSAETPVPIYNRPGLNAIAYRVGNHAAFRESLLASISTSHLKALQSLTTRDNDDFTIALLDAWATVSDILTFYQERIANESYLGTATEQSSVIELARLIGYERRPGVAAGTYLAFTIDENAGRTGGIFTPGSSSKPEPLSLHLQTGIRVQSVPGPEEEPQTFETTEQITVRAEWNSIKPRTTQPQTTIPDNTIVMVAGTANDLKEGDIALIVKPANGKVLKRIIKVVVDEASKTTAIYFSANAQFQSFNTPTIYEPNGDINTYEQKVPLDNSIVTDIISKVWNGEDLSTLVDTQGWSEAELAESVAKNLAEQASAGTALFVFRKRAYVFGYNALMQPTYSRRMPNPPSQWAEWPLSGESNNKIYLDTVYEQILPQSFIAVQGAANTLSTATVYSVTEVDHRPRTGYGISAKSTVVSIASSGSWWGAGTDLSALRNIAIYAQSFPLPLAETPVTENISGGMVMLDRLYLSLKKGQKIILSGERLEPKGVGGSELKTIDEIFVVHGFTVLLFDKPLSHSYLRATVRINANVAAATHGETVTETLGSGDAARAFQKFTLKQQPLTFTSAATPSGTASTLEIRVNDLLWHEVPSLYEHSSDERIYVTHQDNAGKTTVIFGDGKKGARLPGGTENIKATYRKGIGTGGLLKSNQLSQLITRPLGVKSVTNPLKTSDAEDAERLEDAKRNATLTIFTLGRIVSLQDYEDFARSFAGISKALATWTWTGQKRSVYLTIAGNRGTEIEPAGRLYQNLLTAIASTGIPEVPVTVASYQPGFFRLAAKIKVHPDYLPEGVLAAVKAQLLQQFSFDARLFGQPVAFSEVIAIMQQVAGVVAVDVEIFCRPEEPASVKNRIDADRPRPGRGQPFPAELLTIDASAIDLQILP